MVTLPRPCAFHLIKRLAGRHACIYNVGFVTPADAEMWKHKRMLVLVGYCLFQKRTDQTDYGDVFSVDCSHINIFYEKLCIRMEQIFHFLGAIG